MIRTSKYVGKQFGAWTCTHIGVASTQSKKTHKIGENGRHILAKRPGHQSYYYIFERRTSDGKADKMVRLNYAEAAKVYRYQISVEEIVEAREKKEAKKFVSKISYHFI